MATKIAVGLITGGPHPHKEAWWSVAQALHQHFAERVSALGADANDVGLDVQLNLDGPHSRVDWQGVTVGRLSGTTGNIILRVALPDEVAPSPAWVSRVLLDVLPTIDDRLRRRKSPLTTAGLRRLLTD